MSIFINDKPIETFNFSGGECHVSIAPFLPLQSLVQLSAWLYGSDDVMRLLMTVDAIYRENPQAKIDLIIPYFPYARQDRVCNKGEAFSAEVMANLINNLNCNSVTIYDIHSDVTKQKIKNCAVKTQAEIIEDSVVSQKISSETLSLVSPDLGAAVKTAEVGKFLDVEVIYCSKIRDVKTREIRGSSVSGDVLGKNLMILDDICDGGRTFIHLAEKLKGAGAGDLYLYVTHGIFSYGLEPLKEHFKHIYCYHTFLKPENVDSNFLTVIKEM